MKHICIRCKKDTDNYHLMMVKCDDCINEICKQNQENQIKYRQLASGLLIRDI